MLSFIQSRDELPSVSAGDGKTFGMFPVASFVGSGVILHVKGFVFLI